MHAVIYCDIMHNGKRMEAIQVSRKEAGWTDYGTNARKCFLVCQRNKPALPRSIWSYL